MEPADTWHVLAALPLRDRAETFGYLPTERQVELAQTLSRKELAGIVFHMSADERADLFNRLSQEQQEALLPALAQAERDDILRLASYQEGTAGAIMTSDYATLSPHLTAREAIERLRREAPDKETIYQAYVIDDDRHVVGVVSLRDLILAPGHRRVEDFMVRDVISAYVDDLQEEVAEKIQKYDLLALPILNGGDRLVGIVTYDDAMDVVEEETTEDFHLSASVDRLDTSFRDASFGLLYRKRVFWLVLLVFGNLFSGATIAYFEDALKSYIALVVFLPLLVGSSGNAGSQAATLMVRAIATRDVHLRDWGRMLGRELLVAGALGVTMALAISGVGLIRGGSQIALVISLTMIVVVVIGSLVGMSLPFALYRYGFDPATASGPLVTTIADALGVLVYLAIASTILELTPG